MKRFILAIILVLAFGADSLALNLRPYMQTPPEVQTFCKRVLDDGGTVVDVEYMDKTVKLLKQLGVWSNVKFLGDANMAYKSGVTTTVAKLYDLSGNNNDAVQATGANQPVWTAGAKSGKAGLVFDGTNDYLSSSYTYTGSETGFSFLFVASPGAAQSSLEGFFSPGRSAADIRWFFIIGSSAVDGLGWAGTAGEVHLGAEAVGANVFKVRSYLKSSTVWNVWSNGSQVSTNTADTSMPNAGAFTQYIGAEDSIQYFLSGTILTTIMLDVILTLSQRIAIETFLNAYYSIY